MVRVLLGVVVVVLAVPTVNAEGEQAKPARELRVQGGTPTSTVDLWDAWSSADACQDENGKAVIAGRMEDVDKASVCVEGTIAHLTNGIYLEQLDVDKACGKEMTHVKVTSGKHQGKVGCVWSQFVKEK